MENEQMLDALIACQLEIIKSIQSGERVLSLKDQVESLSVGIKSLQTLIDIKHSLESNRLTDIALDPSSYASHEGKSTDIALASAPLVSYEGKSAGIVRSLKNVFQAFKEANLMQQ